MSGVLAAVASGGGTVDIVNASVFDTETAPTAALGRITVNTDGTVAFIGDSSSSDYDWFSPAAGAPGDGFEIHLAVDSGDNPTAGEATSTWLALSSNRAWTWGVSSGSLSANCTLSIRPLGGSTIDTATITVIVASV